MINASSAAWRNDFRQKRSVPPCAMTSACSTRCVPRGSGNTWRRWMSHRQARTRQEGQVSVTEAYPWLAEQAGTSKDGCRLPSLRQSITIGQLSGWQFRNNTVSTKPGAVHGLDRELLDAELMRASAMPTATLRTEFRTEISAQPLSAGLPPALFWPRCTFKWVHLCAVVLRCFSPAVFIMRSHKTC